MRDRATAVADLHDRQLANTVVNGGATAANPQDLLVGEYGLAPVVSAVLLGEGQTLLTEHGSSELLQTTTIYHRLARAAVALTVLSAALVVVSVASRANLKSPSSGDKRPPIYNRSHNWGNISS